MKKMMVALAGIVSVLMLASCQKVVEVDGDVSMAKVKHSYRMEITGTASYVLAEYDSVKKEWKAKEGAKPVELVANEGWLYWSDEEDTNQKSYGIDVWYNGDTAKAVLDFEVLGLDELIEYKGEFYMPDDVKPKNKVTVTGSPRDDSFSVKVSNRYVERYGEDVLLTFDLTFSR